MTRRGTAVILVGLLAAPLALATGFGSNNPPSRIPVPAKVFSATVEDRGGTSLHVTRVSYNGEVFLYGTIGAAQVTVPFESIREAQFEDTPTEGKRVAAITTNDGQTLRITVDDDILCYGRTEFGNYSIEVRDLRKIGGIALESASTPSTP
jgi:hypothetical protein